MLLLLKAISTDIFLVSVIRKKKQRFFCILNVRVCLITVSRNSASGKHGIMHTCLCMYKCACLLMDSIIKSAKFFYNLSAGAMVIWTWFSDGTC